MMVGPASWTSVTPWLALEGIVTRRRAPRVSVGPPVCLVPRCFAGGSSLGAAVAVGATAQKLIATAAATATRLTTGRRARRLGRMAELRCVCAVIGSSSRSGVGRIDTGFLVSFWIDSGVLSGPLGSPWGWVGCGVRRLAPEPVYRWVHAEIPIDRRWLAQAIPCDWPPSVLWCLGRSPRPAHLRARGCNHLRPLATGPIGGSRLSQVAR